MNIGSPHITQELFDFLRELEKNNNRPWFQANKDRYERHVKEPLLRFISDFVPHLATVSTHFVADPRSVGGSLFRIYRDTRFSRDKTPYKTHAGLHFRHRRGKDVHAPGFYLHLEPGGCFVGMGIWHPESATLKQIRDAIVARPNDWERAISDPDFAAHFQIQGDVLKRPPRGFDPHHPWIEDIKRKDFVAGIDIAEADTMHRDFIDRFADLCRRGTPFMRFLAGALGLEW